MKTGLNSIDYIFDMLRINIINVSSINKIYSNRNRITEFYEKLITSIIEHTYPIDDMKQMLSFLQLPDYILNMFENEWYDLDVDKKLYIDYILYNNI